MQPRQSDLHLLGHMISSGMSVRLKLAQQCGCWLLWALGADCAPPCGAGGCSCFVTMRHLEASPLSLGVLGISQSWR